MSKITPKIQSIAMLVAALSITACATTAPPVQQVEPGPSAIDLRIDAMAQNVTRVLTELSALEQSRQNLPAPPQSAAENLPADHPLMTPVTLAWSGDARHALARLGHQAGIAVSVEGISPVMPLVKIDVQAAPLARVLENVGMQVGRVADIRYNESEKLLVLAFRQQG